MLYVSIRRVSRVADFQRRNPLLFLVGASPAERKGEGRCE